MTNNLKPIGVFDSGVGGITALKEIQNLMPNENIVYFGDTGRVPYGSKSRDIILRYAKQDISFLKSLGVKMIVAACGTVSSVMSVEPENIGIPFVGVVYPTCLAAVKATRNKKIGIIGTETTIRSNSYDECIKLIDKDIKVYKKSCPMFVPLIENGISSFSFGIVNGIVRESLSYFSEYDIDVLILGCTHYPIIEDLISDAMGDNIKLINSGKETARYALQILKEKNLKSQSVEKGKYKFFVSDSVETFSGTVTKFLGYDIIEDIEEISIDLY